MSASSCCSGKGQEQVPAPATSLGRCRAHLTRGLSETYSFCRLAPRHLQANTVTGVPLLLLHVLEIPQVTVCPGVSGEGERSREPQSWPPCHVPQGPSGKHPWSFTGRVLGDGQCW